MPALAQCTVDTACITVNVGDTGTDIVNALDGAWDLDIYSCDASANSIIIGLKTGIGPERTITFFVGGGVTVFSHTIRLRAASVLGGGELPLDLLMDYDSAGEVLLRDGTHDFPEVTLVVQTAAAPASSVPMLDGKRAGAFVACLLLAGVVLIVMRR